MKKIIFFLFLAATLVACQQPCPEKSWEEEYLLTKADLRQVQTEVTELRIDTATLQGEILCLRSKLLAAGLSTKCLEEPVTKVAPAPKPIVKAPAVKPVPMPAPVVKKSVSVPMPAPIVQPEPAPIVRSVVRAEPIATMSIFDVLKENDGAFRFCARVNGREDQYFPDYLVRKGERIIGAEDNGRQGHNIVVYAPTNGFSNPNGSITDGGIIYYPADVIEKYFKNVQYVDFFYSKKWGIPMRAQKTGSWYVYETQN